MKQQIIPRLVSFYQFLLRLYPRHFREEFGEEMTAVFHQALTTAPNNWHILIVSLRELRDWPMSCWREHQRSLGMISTKPIIWVNEHKRRWRTAVFILLLIAMIGPWSMDKIYVPAEYVCSTAVRLEGDFCGIPLSGIWIFFAILGNFFSVTARLITDAQSFTNVSREIIFSILYLFLIVPFITTLRLILGKNHRFWSQRLSLGLAVTVALLFWGLSNLSVPPLTLWGFWLYIMVIIAALIMEMLTVRTDKTTAQEIVLSE